MDGMIKRSNIIVKRKLQIKYAMVILIAMLVTAVTVGADFYIRLYGFIGDFVKDLPDRSVNQLMANMNQLMYAKVIVLVIIAVAVSLYISHKFAGPIVHLEKSIDKLSKGDLAQKLYFRAGDELKHLAQYFNYMISRIRESVESDRKTIEDMKVSLNSLKTKVIDAESKEAVEELLVKADSISKFWRL